MDTVARQVHGVVTEQHHATVRTTNHVHQSQQVIAGPVTQSGPVTTGSSYVGTVGTGYTGGIVSCGSVGGNVISGGIVGGNVIGGYGGYGGSIVSGGIVSGGIIR